MRSTRITALSFTIVAVAFVGCEQAATAPETVAPEVAFNFTNGPSAPNMVVMRDPAAPFVGSNFITWNLAAFATDFPGAGQAGNERPLIAFHYTDPANNTGTFDIGCGDGSGGGGLTVDLQAVSTPSEAENLLEVYKDKDTPVEVYEATFWDLLSFLPNLCDFFAATPKVAEGTATLNGHIRGDEDGTPFFGKLIQQLIAHWQGTLTTPTGGSAHYVEMLHAHFNSDGSITNPVAAIQVRPIGK